MGKDESHSWTQTQNRNRILANRIQKYKARLTSEPSLVHIVIKGLFNTRKSVHVILSISLLVKGEKFNNMITLCILDGFGVNKNELGNAVAAAGTPNLDKLKKE